MPPRGFLPGLVRGQDFSGGPGRFLAGACFLHLQFFIPDKIRPLDILGHPHHFCCEYHDIFMAASSFEVHACARSGLYPGDQPDALRRLGRLPKISFSRVGKDVYLYWSLLFLPLRYLRRSGSIY